jgi:DNA replication protein DnaC
MYIPNLVHTQIILHQVYWGANESRYNIKFATGYHFSLHCSSNSFSMLPSRPRIFYGRESELDNMMKMLSQQPAQIAILGGGGMGKTSLARAVLHHPCQQWPLGRLDNE